MIVAQPLRGQDPVLLNPRSRTLYNPVSARNIESMRASLENPRLEAAPLFRGGLGAVSIPDWAYWLGGGIAAGVAVGAAVYFVKKRR
jgi:hypothetical protein